ncbi:MAG TPA: class I SAM-dependent methyltransferase [Actinomycetales bacterium]|jgi:SAM-dependent methyltransferase
MTPGGSGAQPPRALTFGSVAEAYERHRLGYPDEVVDEVLRYAGRPVGNAVEIGAGTGKATTLFASRGIDVTAVEPDADMARVLRRTTTGLPVEVMVTTYEQLHLDRRFDLLVAAASWHWTDPATRWTRAAQLLVPGGVVALLGRDARLCDPALAEAVLDVEREVLADGDGGSAGVHPWSLDETVDVLELTDAVELLLPDPVTTTPAGYVGQLATVSAYLVLDAQVRDDALRRIEAILPDRVDIDSTVQVSMVRRI